MAEEKIKELIYHSGLAARDYKFEQEIPQRPNPLKLSKWVAHEIKEVNAQIDKLEEKINVQCTCQRGCSACCKQLIAVVMPECLAIKPYIENLTTAEKEQLKQKVLRQCEILEENNITNSELNRLGKGEGLQEQYFNLDMPCVFLDEENSCIIHDVRPTLCWSYRNYGNTSDCCKSYSVDTTIKYGDWEKRIFERILAARPIKKGLYVLPFAIREMMGW